MEAAQQALDEAVAHRIKVTERLFHARAAVAAGAEAHKGVRRLMSQSGTTQQVSMRRTFQNHRIPGLSVDIDQPGMAAHVAQSRAVDGDIILFSSNARMRAGWTFNWVNQLRHWHRENWLILTDRNETCSLLQRGWEPMTRLHREMPLACIWSSYPPSHPGWSQWGLKSQSEKIFWATRWWVALQLLRQGVNILSLDVDAVLLADVTRRITQPSHCCMCRLNEATRTYTCCVLSPASE